MKNGHAERGIGPSLFQGVEKGPLGKSLESMGRFFGTDREGSYGLGKKEMTGEGFMTGPASIR